MSATFKTAVLAAALGCGLSAAASAATVTPTGPDSYNVSLGTFELFTTVYSTTLTTATTVSFTVATAGMNILAIIGGLEVDGDAYATSMTLASTSYSFDLEAGTYAVILSNFGTAGTFSVTDVELTEIGTLPVVPAPATLPLIAGALGLGALAKRRRKAA